MAGLDSPAPTLTRSDPRRDPAAVSYAISARWRIYRLRGYIFGAVVGLLLGVIPAAIATTMVILLLALSGLLPDLGVAWTEIVWTIAFLLVFAASGAWAVTRWLPARFKAAVESYVWLATRAEAHWAAVFDAPVPRKVPAMRAFLDAATLTPESAGDIATIWLALGDLDNARKVVATMPESTATERHQRLAIAWLIDFVGGNDGSLEPLEASAARIDDPTDRLEAQVEIAIDAARVALARNVDWIAPMAAVRAGLGPEPSALMWRLAFPPAFRTMLLFGGIAAISFCVFSLVT